MIALLVAGLTGFAGGIAAWVLFGGDVSATIAGFAAAAILGDAIRDVLQGIYDRRQAYRRWHEWERGGDPDA